MLFKVHYLYQIQTQYIFRKKTFYQKFQDKFDKMSYKYIYSGVRKLIVLFNQ